MSIIKKCFKAINSYYLLFKCKLKWYKRRKLEKNNTYIKRVIDINKIKVGKETYGPLDIIDYNPKMGKSNVVIGCYVSIAEGTQFLLGGGHHINYISTYPFLNRLYNEEESLDRGNIIISDDVWIGKDVTIMSGVTIGQGAIIGTKALVTKNIPPYSIAVGIPARVIKYRFDKKTIDKLLKIDYKNLSLKDIKDNIEIFERYPENLDIEKVIAITSGVN